MRGPITGNQREKYNAPIGVVNCSADVKNICTKNKKTK